MPQTCDPGPAGVVTNKSHYETANSAAGSRPFLFWKGRVALYAILKAMGIGPRDDVVVPGFTCVVVPQAVRFTGARPIYVDVEPDTFNIDAKGLAAVLTPNTRAVIVQHTFGLAADIDAVRAVTEARGIQIIEDCAHTMGTTYRGKEVGSLGDAAFFSTQWSKPITTGLGGIAVARDPLVAARLDKLEGDYATPSLRETCALYLQQNIHKHFFKPALYWTALDWLHGLARFGMFVGSSSAQELTGEKPGDYEKRMAGFQAELLRKGTVTAGANWDHRRRIAGLYAERLAQIGLNGIRVLPGTAPVILRFPVIVRDKVKVVREARKRRVEIGDWFVSPLHPLTEHLERVCYKGGECPVAENASRHVINLPTHPRINESEAARICEFLAEVAA